MLSFKKFLEYRNPDSFYKQGEDKPSTTFIYGGNYKVVPKLFTAPFPEMHGGMLQNPEIFKYIFGDWADDSSDAPYKDWWKEAHEMALLGRVGSNGEEISIWNRDPQLVDRLYPAAINELISGGFAKPNAVIHSPTMQSTPASSIAGVKSQQVSPENASRLDMMRQIHLAPSNQKAALMRQLYGNSINYSPKNNWNKAIQSVGQPPGQKYWAPSSESFNSNGQCFSN